MDSASHISEYDTCALCPRACGARRNASARGVCGANDKVRIARAALHFWEEPPISGEAGSGAIFFSGCPLKCIFCQNQEISSGNFGQDITVRRLAQIMLELQDQGALNINLVTPSHYTPQVIQAIKLAQGEGLTLPIVCNTSGYETLETVHALASVVDIWLTDYKYATPSLATELSRAADYPEVAHAALGEMLASLRTHGGERLDAEGRMTQGIIVRHLVLPSHVDDSCEVLRRVWQLCGNEVSMSIMNQYTPNEACRKRTDDLAYPLPTDEYDAVLDCADELGFERVFWQEGGAVSESFIPAFDTTGVEGPEL